METPFFKSEKCFRRYERVIARIVERFPRETQFKSIKRKPSTDAARLADAMNSYRTENWASDLIDREKFLDSVHRAVEIIPMSDGVVVGPHRPKEVEIVDTIGVGEKVAGDILRPTDHQIRVAFEAIECGVVELPIILHELSTEQREMLEELEKDSLNVALRCEGESVILV